MRSDAVQPPLDAAGVRALPIGVLGGVLLGLLILAAGSASLKWLLILAAAGCVPALFLVLGSLTRVFQALLIFSLSMGLDFFIGFSEEFAVTRPGIPVTLTVLLLCCLYGLGLADGSARSRPGRTRSATIPFALLVGWAALSSFVAVRPDYVIQALPGYVTSFLLYLYARRLMTTDEGIFFTARWIAIAVLFSGVLALVQFATGGSPNLTLLGGSATQIVQGYQNEQISRVSGLLHHPNTFAVFLNGFLPVLLVLASTANERWRRRLCAAAFGLGVVALILTYSRGGWLSFGVSLALLGIATPKTQWRPGLGTGLLTVTALSLLVVLLFATPLYSRIVTRLAEDDQGAAQSRVALLRSSASMIAQHPIAGVGVNNYQFASPVVTDDRGVPLLEAGDGLPMRVHNLFLLTAVELGLPGLLLLGITVVLLIAQTVPAIRRGSRLESRVALGLTCGLAAILTHCMLEPATLADPSYLILSFVGGCGRGIAVRSSA